MLKDKQKVSMAKMAIHIHIFTISLKKTKLYFKEENIFFFRVTFHREYALGFTCPNF